MFTIIMALQSGGAAPSNQLGVGTWIAIAGFLVTIVGGLIACGRFLGTLNGFGTRLTELETAHDKETGERAEMQRQFTRVLDQHGSILERLGEAKRSAEKCSEETQDLAIAIGSKIDGVSREVNGMNLQLSQRIKAVETVLKIRDESR